MCLFEACWRKFGVCELVPLYEDRLSVYGLNRVCVCVLFAVRILDAIAGVLRFGKWLLIFVYVFVCVLCGKRLRDENAEAKRFFDQACVSFDVFVCVCVLE